MRLTVFGDGFDLVVLGHGRKGRRINKGSN